MERGERASGLERECAHWGSCRGDGDQRERAWSACARHRLAQQQRGSLRWSRRRASALRCHWELEEHGNGGWSEKMSWKRKSSRTNAQKRSQRTNAQKRSQRTNVQKRSQRMSQRMSQRTSQRKSQRMSERSQRTKKTSEKSQRKRTTRGSSARS